MERLKEVLEDNLETSMNTLGDYIRTIVQTWIPNEERIRSVMSCFPYHCGPSIQKIDENDYSLTNIERLERIIRELKHSKMRVSRRLEEIESRLKNYEDLLEDLKNKRTENAKTIEIVEDKEFENF